MPENRNIRSLVVALALLIGGIVLVSCSEKQSSFIIDEEEIQLYINSSDVGQELFPKTGLIPSDPFVLPEDTGATYRALVDSVHRQIVVVIPTKVLSLQSENVYGTKHSYVQDFGAPYYLTSDAEATVEDRYYLKTERVKGTDTTSYPSVRYVTKYGYFIKAGSDAEAFSGWLLIGYSGITYAGVNRVYDPTYIRRPGGTAFEAYTALKYKIMSSVMIDVTSSSWDTVDVNWETDRAYILLSGLNAIDSIEADVPVKFTVSPTAPIHTIAYQNGSTYDSRNLRYDDSSGDTASVTIKTPSVQRWGVLYFQGFLRQPGDNSTIPAFNTLQVRNWVIPFRVVH